MDRVWGCFYDKRWNLAKMFNMRFNCKIRVKYAKISHCRGKGNVVAREDYARDR